MKIKTSIYLRHFAFAYVLLVAVIFCGCEEPKPQNLDPTKNVTTNVMNNPDFQIVTVDSCEYVLYCSLKSTNYSGAWTSGLTHKGNCKFCAERSKK